MTNPAPHDHRPTHVPASGESPAASGEPPVAARPIDGTDRTTAAASPSDALWLARLTEAAPAPDLTGHGRRMFDLGYRAGQAAERLACTATSSPSAAGERSRDRWRATSLALGLALMVSLAGPWLPRGERQRGVPTAHHATPATPHSVPPIPSDGTISDGHASDQTGGRTGGEHDSTPVPSAEPPAGRPSVSAPNDADAPGSRPLDPALVAETSVRTGPERPGTVSHTLWTWIAMAWLPQNHDSLGQPDPWATRIGPLADRAVLTSWGRTDGLIGDLVPPLDPRSFDRLALDRSSFGRDEARPGSASRQGAGPGPLSPVAQVRSMPPASRTPTWTVGSPAIWARDGQLNPLDLGRL